MRCITLAAVYFIARPLHAELLEKTVKVSGTTVQYKVVLPTGYDRTKAYPAILAFGGAALLPGLPLQFRKKWLRDYFTAQPWYKPLAKDDNAKVTAQDRANASLIAQAEEGQKRSDLKARRDDILARQRAGKASPEDDIELGIINTRLGQWTSAETAAKPPANVSPLEDPSQLDHLITVAQLSNLSRRDLRILRNTIYARHGRQFKSQLLQEYFDTMEWYKADPGFTDKALTKIDTTNVRLIKSVEDTLGGPMTEDEQRADANMSGS
jgi:hypothetical protein